MKINNLIKDNISHKSKINTHLIEESESKLKNDNIYYEKYHELENELNLLKNSVADKENQNKELKKQVNGLDTKKNNDNNKLKELLQPIKVNIKENIKHTNTDKNNNYDLITKENNKLLKEINIYKEELEECIQKIKDLSLIIKNKDNCINELKSYINDGQYINNIEQKIEMDKEKTNFEVNNNINESLDKIIHENDDNNKEIKETYEAINNIGNIEKDYININSNEEIESNTTILTNKNFHNNYQIEKNEIIILNNINKYNHQINFQIQKNQIIIQNSISKKEKTIDYKIQKHQITIINNKTKNNKLEIININSFNFISKKKKNKEKKQKSLNNGKMIDIQYDIKNQTEKEIEIDNLLKENKSDSINKLTDNNIEEMKTMQIQPEVQQEEVEIINKRQDNNETKIIEEHSQNNISSNLNDNFDQAIKEIKEEIEEKVIKRKSFKKKKIKILDGIDILEINTSSPVNIQSSISFFSDNNIDINKNYLHLYGLNKDNTFLKFDLINKKWLKQIKINDIEDLSDSFQDNYIYINTIIYNVLNGFLILTGKKTNILYYYNAINETISNICEFNDNHNEGNMLFDKENKRIFVFSGKNNKICEYYSFNDKKVYKMPELNIDRTNSSFIIHKNRIYCFFGYSYLNEKYNNTIEYIDIQKLDNWEIIPKINYDNFNIEYMATLNFKEEYNNIYLYCGIKYNDDKRIEDNIIIFDTESNQINIIKEFNCTQYKLIGSRWRKCDITNEKEKRFIFEKNTNFIQLPYIENNTNSEIYDNTNKLDFNNVKVLIDGSNNIHYFLYDSKHIEIFRSYYK